MWRITGMRMCWIALTMALLTVPRAEAKKAAEPATAPIPLQVLSGKRVFISYLKAMLIRAPRPDLQRVLRDHEELGEIRTGDGPRGR